MRKGTLYQDKATGLQVFVDQTTGELFAQVPEAVRPTLQMRNPQYEELKSTLRFLKTAGNLGLGPDLSETTTTASGSDTFWTKLSDSFNKAWTNEQGEPSTFQNLFTKLADNVNFDDGIQWGGNTQSGPVVYDGGDWSNHYRNPNQGGISNAGLYLGGGLAFAALIFALIKAND